MSSRQKRKGPSAGETEGSQTDDLQTWALEPNRQYGDLMLSPPGSSTTDQPRPHGAASALLNTWGLNMTEQPKFLRLLKDAPLRKIKAENELGDNRNKADHKTT